MDLFREKYTCPMIKRGSNNFQGGVQLFQGWGGGLISIETHITCDFPGGSGHPIPPPPLD